MTPISYLISMRSTDDTTYVMTREGSDGNMHDAATGLALAAALDLFKTWVLANPGVKITATVIPGV